MSDKTNAISLLKGAYKELALATHDIPDERMLERVAGEWSAKDILAHLASWDEFAAADLRRVARGHIPCLAAYPAHEVDAFNEFMMKPRRTWPLVQVRFESEHWHEELMNAFNILPESMFAPGQPVAAFASSHLRHYQEHTAAIRAWWQHAAV
jgi:hypothetical protein